MTKKRVKRLVFTNIDTGETVVVKTSLKKWSEERGLDYKCMWSLCYGVRKIYRGWYVGTTPPIPTVKKTRKGEKRKPLSDEHKRKISKNPFIGQKVVSPGGEVFEIEGTLTETAEKLGISYWCLVNILKTGKKTNKWQRYGQYLVEEQRKKEESEQIAEHRKVIKGPEAEPGLEGNEDVRRGIYCITNLVNGKFYIGSTTNAIKRFSSHKKNLKRGKHVNVHLQNAWNKYGEKSFKFSFLKEMKNASVEELKTEEQKYIDLYYDGGENCYNLSKVADRPEAEAKKKPVLQLNKDTGEIIKEWPSAADVETEWKGELVHMANQIGAACRGILISAYGYRWKFKDEKLALKYSLREKKSGSENMKRRVAQVELGNQEQIIEVYDSLQAAANQNGIKTYIQVLQVCNGNKKTAGGKAFKYLTEEEYQEFLEKKDIKKDRSNPPENVVGSFRCLECLLNNNSLRALSSHLQFVHKMKSEDYTIKHFYEGKKPTCAVEGCENETRYTAYRYNKYCKLPEHQKFAMKEGGKVGGKENKKAGNEERSQTEEISGPTDMFGYGCPEPLFYRGSRITPTFLKSLSKEDRELIADALFHWFRNRGFPFPVYREVDLQKEWNSLKDLDTSNMKIPAETRVDIQNHRNFPSYFISNKNVVGNKISQHFNGTSFYSTKETKRSSMLEAFSDDELLKKTIRNRLGITYKEVFHMHGAMLRQGFRSSGIASSTSVFNCALAKFVYENYAIQNGVVFDFSMGFGHRMLGALASSKGLTYVGCDPWSAVVSGNRNLASFLKQEKRVSLHTCGSESFDPLVVVPDGVDVVFSSPPYFDKEIYDEGNSSQSVYRRSYKEWLDDWWTKTIFNSVRAMKGLDSVFILNMAEEIATKTGSIRILDDMLEVCKNHGLVEVDRIGYLFSRSHFSKVEKANKEQNTMKFEPIVILKKVLQGNENE